MENKTYEIEGRWMRRFIPIWTAQIFSLLGSGLVQFALVWWITQQTGSAAFLAMATFVAILPEVLLAPFIGAFVDRLNRRYVMIFADGIVALFTLGLAVLFAFNKIQIWHIFVAIFIRSVGGSFHWSAMQASTSLMVPEKHLPRIAGINTALRGGMNIIAPPLGALLMSLLQFYQVIAVDVVTAIIAITPLCFIRIPQPVRSDAATKISAKMIMSDVVEGFKFLKHWKGIFYVTLMAAMINFLLVPSDTLMPLMVTQHFKAGVWELSILESAFGFGVVAGGLLLGAWGGFKRKVVTCLCGILGIGAGVMIFGLAPSDQFWFGLAGMVLAGIMNPIANGPLQALVQTKVPPEMQGRVMGSMSSICTAMMPISMLVVTPVAEFLGLRVWYWAGGALTILVGLAAFFVPSIMNLENAKMESVMTSVTTN